MAQTVKRFVEDSYQLVSASSPTVPLHGNDMLKGVQFLNELVQSFSGTGLMTTIAKEIVYSLSIGQQLVTFGDASVVPTPDVSTGRLSNLQNAWIMLEGVSYPLIDMSRNVFFAAYKYEPLQGLPRYAIIRNDTEITTMRIYPAPSQVYELHVFGKFELPIVTENDTMIEFPNYYIRYLRFALAKDLAMYKGRANAWTPELENMLIKAEKDMQSVSAINLAVQTDRESLLNGAWRVRAGI